MLKGTQQKFYLNRQSEIEELKKYLGGGDLMESTTDTYGKVLDCSNQNDLLNSSLPNRTQQNFNQRRSVHLLQKQKRARLSSQMGSHLSAAAASPSTMAPLTAAPPNPTLPQNSTKASKLHSTHASPTPQPTLLQRSPRRKRGLGGVRGSVEVGGGGGGVRCGQDGVVW